MSQESASDIETEISSESPVREEPQMTQQDEEQETFTSSPANHITMNDTVMTLGNNTGGNDDFEDTEQK